MTAETYQLYKRMRIEPWEKLEVELRNIQLPNSSPLEEFRTALNAEVWDLRQSVKKRGSDFLFLEALIALRCERKSSVILDFLRRINKAKLPGWMTDWVELELAGRSLKFNEQAKKLKKIIENNEADPSWALHACLFSIGVYERRSLAAWLDKNQLPKTDLAIIFKAKFGFYESDDEALSELDLINQDSDWYPWVLRVKILIYRNQGNIVEALRHSDGLANSGRINLSDLMWWLQLSLSNPAGFQFLEARILHASKIAYGDLRVQGALVSNFLIYCWLTNRAHQASILIGKYKAFEDLSQDSLRPNQIFFKYIRVLFANKIANPWLYCEKSVSSELIAIGESHALPLLNAIVEWKGEMVRGGVRFVMGSQMHHLAKIEPNQYKSNFIDHLKSLPASCHLLITVGEIDCRINGMWKYARDHHKNIQDVINKTVDGYVDWIANQVADKSFRSVTLQGIPAPNLKSKAEVTSQGKSFLEMFLAVNQRLRDKCEENNFGFLDVYAATVAEDGFSNQKWHVDTVHIAPVFYSECKPYLVG